MMQMIDYGDTFVLMIHTTWLNMVNIKLSAT